MTHAGHSMPRAAACPLTRRRKAISPKSKRNWVKLNSAVATLQSLAASSDDPDYGAQLARVLRDAGRDGESRHWRRLAAERYDELLARHPEAFADHAAEFWLAAGADPDKALRLAKMNLEVRNTPRARALLTRAVAAKASFCR
jgi:hypothetical protein